MTKNASSYTVSMSMTVNSYSRTVRMSYTFPWWSTTATKWTLWCKQQSMRRKVPPTHCFDSSKEQFHKHWLSQIDQYTLSDTNTYSEGELEKTKQRCGFLKVSFLLLVYKKKNSLQANVMSFLKVRQENILVTLIAGGSTALHFDNLTVSATLREHSCYSCWLLILKIAGFASSPSLSGSENCYGLKHKSQKNCSVYCIEDQSLLIRTIKRQWHGKYTLNQTDQQVNELCWFLLERAVACWLSLNMYRNLS